MKKLIYILLLIFFVWTEEIFSQVNNLTNISGTTTPLIEYLGWDGTGGNIQHLDIANFFNTGNHDIRFLTNPGAGILERMRLLNTGELGIGTATPGELLTVLGGNIDVNTINLSYMINGSEVLWHAGNTNNIFVGVGAGGTSSGPNTCIGFNAGNGITGGGSNVTIGDDAGSVLANSGGNTFVGHEAGMDQTSGGENTFLGSFAGTDNVSGVGNTYVGSDAGKLCTTANNNTMVGYSAGLKNTNTSNTFLGGSAGYNNTTGRDNTFVGYDACSGNVSGHGVAALGISSGSNSRLNNNTFLGAGSDVANTMVENATAVGKGSIVPDDDQMILGENTINVGIGLSNDNTNGLTYVGPGNKLEINAGQYGGNGFERPQANDPAYSGLRFRNMTEICSTEPNEGLGILSVNEEGDVIYVEDIGNYCNESPQRPLRGNYEIPLDNGSNAYDYYFSGQKDGSSNVIVGLPCGTSHPSAKFQSFQLMNQNSVSESLAGLFYNQTGNRDAIGAVGISDQSEYKNFGLKGHALEYIGACNVGVIGTTMYSPPLLNNRMNAGVYGYANLWTGPGTSSHVNYAVVGDLGPACAGCTSGTAGGANDFAGYFNGDIYTTAGFYAPSDSTLKENVSDILNPMDVINSLNPKAYTFKQQQNESMILPKGTHYGMFAQEIASVLPDAVKNVVHPARYDSLGNETHPEINLLAVNNSELIPFLVAAIKEQQQSIEALHAEVQALSGGGNRFSNPGNEEEENDDKDAEKNSIDVQLTNAKAIILNQNVPNPFAEQTSISYFITDDVKKAQIFFYDNKGTILKIVDINEKGEGQLNVFAADLSSGNYSYTLIADGKVVQTKTMVKQ